MNNEVKNGIIITITVILILAVVYLTTAVFLTGEIGSSKTDKKSNTTSTNNENGEVSSLYDDMIIASKTFNQPKDEYMVIFFSENDASDALKTAISSYDSSSKGIKLYKVNTSEAINKYVLSSDANSSATNASELKINDVTVITIKNNVITSYVTEESNVINELK